MSPVSLAVAGLSLLAPLSAQTVGSVVNSGEGCPNQRIAPIYELFQTGSFDLANTALTFTPSGQFYNVTNTGTMLPFGPSSGSLDIVAGDDTIRGPLFLTTPFTYVGGNGVTQAIDVAPNGYIYLESGTITDTRCCNGSLQIADFHDQGPSIAAFGTDLNPATQGTIWFNTSPGLEYITWDNVIEESAPGGTGITVQVQLFAGGTFSIVYGNASAQTDDVLVGYSLGGGAPDVGSIDISASVPLSFTGPLGSPPVLSSGLVPTIGQQFSIDVEGLPMSTAAGALLLGTAPVMADLTAIGAETCQLLTNATLGSVPFVLTGTTGTAALGMTTDPNFVGSGFVTQGAFIAPGITTLGVVVSDRATLTFGNSAPVIVRANGTNNFNSDATTGFWSVNNTGVLAITTVEFDWSTAGTNNVFDSDQTGMADRFDGGNSPLGGCTGTYRNGSDVTTGLVYAISGASACDPAATTMTGWVGSNPGTTAGTYETLTFTFGNFGPGDVFELDIDTDGGPTGGDDMAGMVVTIGFSDGSTRTGTLAAIGTDMSEAIL